MNDMRHILFCAPPPPASVIQSCVYLILHLPVPAYTQCNGRFCAALAACVHQCAVYTFFKAGRVFQCQVPLLSRCIVLAVKSRTPGERKADQKGICYDYLIYVLNY